MDPIGFEGFVQHVNNVTITNSGVIVDELKSDVVFDRNSLEESKPEPIEMLPTAAQTQLHVMENYRKNVQRVPTFEKTLRILKCACYSRCESTTNSGVCCNCLRWKSIGCNNDTLQNEQVDCILQLKCADCQHELREHFPSGFLDDEQLINNMFINVEDFEDIAAKAENSTDCDLKQIFRFVASAYEESFRNRTVVNFDMTLGTPPFEDLNIIDIFENFLFYRYKNVKRDDYVKITQAIRVILCALEYWFMEIPTRYFTMIEGYSSRLDYRLMFYRWMVYCKIPRLHCSLKAYKTVDVFGKLFLQYNFSLLTSHTVSKFMRTKDRLNSADLELLFKILPHVIKFFEMELKQVDISPIFKTTFHREKLYNLGLRTNFDQNTSDKRKLNEICATEKESNKKTKLSARNRVNAINTYGIIQNSIKNNSDSSTVIEINPYFQFEQKIQSILQKIDDKNNSYGFEKLLKIAAPRDELAKQQEKNNIINVQLLGVALPDDKQHENFNKLLYLQHIFSRQLTEMPKSYIAQVVFDAKHLTLALLKNNQPIAGICFCPFFEQGFTEIVFCAVLDGEQVQGYGSHLMNHLKDLHVQNDIMHLLAFADNKAIGYFEKQGFSKDIRLTESRYKDYIKDYTASVLMHCELAPNITYTEYISVIQKQKAIIEELINEQKNVVKYPGLDVFKTGYKCISINSIPGIENLCTKPSTSLRKNSSNINDETPVKEINSQLKQILVAVKNHDCALPFLRPVNKTDVPDYYDVIKYPMDLQTMTKRLNDGYYVIRRLFLADMKRIFTNCRIYNCPDTWVFKYAVTLEKFFQLKWEAICK